MLVCFETLQHPLDSFQRRYFSLSILLLMSELFQNPSVTQFEFSGLVPDPLAKGLVYVLWDSFESNRIIIIELMKTLNKRKDIVSLWKYTVFIQTLPSSLPSYSLLLMISSPYQISLITWSLVPNIITVQLVTISSHYWYKLILNNLWIVSCSSPEPLTGVCPHRWLW